MNNLDLIKQYVDTGVKLPEYQVSKLNKNLGQTYIRKRLISVKQDTDSDNYLSNYEFILLPENIKNTWFDKMASEMRIGTWDDYDELFKYGGSSITLKKLIGESEPSDETDNLFFMALKNKNFYDNLTISAINTIIYNSKNILGITNLIGDEKWKKFLNAYDTKRYLKHYFSSSHYPENTLKAFGPELQKKINEESDSSYLWDITNSPVPQKLFYMFPNRVNNMVEILKLSFKDKNDATYKNMCNNAVNPIELRKIFVDNNIPTDEIDRRIVY